MRSKTCAKCATEKSESDFCRSTRGPGGLQSWCKACSKATNKAKRMQYAAHRNEHRRARRKTDESWAARERERTRAFRESLPKQQKAHRAVRDAIRRGHLQKLPCEECGRATAVAHHDDYDKPLSVRWLCPHHHQLWHVENGPGLNSGIYDGYT